VNGDSPLLLEQVRKVESGAFLQTLDGQRLIQAGSFNEANRAEQQVQALELQGIGAEIITAPAVVAAQPQLISAAPSPVIPSPDLTPAPASQGVVFGQAPSFNTPTPTSGGTLIAAANSYYVAIPGRTEDLEDIRNQVIRLGGSLGVAQSVIQRQSPLGPHVLVGPFINRRAAERWNHYLRSFGMDARVYYRR
jgi:cell division protein FtsN